jgi:hypothetical protein
MVLQTPIQTWWNTSVVRTVTILGLPQQSVGLGAIMSNHETKCHALSINYYSSIAKTRALDASGNPINNLKVNTEIK